MPRLARCLRKLILFAVLIASCPPLGLAGAGFNFDSNDLSPRAIKLALTQNVKGYKIGIALSGGGARGFAHIGVLEELEKNGIQVDAVAGTSMGGVIGGLYAVGMPPRQIEEVANGINWSDFFSDRPTRGAQLFTRKAEMEGDLLTLRFDHLNPQIPTALSSGQQLINVLSSLTQTPSYFSKGDFANFDRKLAIVATDIVTGKEVVFESGSLVEALRATMGVPLAFTPFEQGNWLLMDGGLLEPVPTRTARQLGADFVIAVDATSDLLPMKEIVDPIDIANQTTTILSAETQKRLLEQADFVITPDLSGIKATEFDKKSIAVVRGREAVLGNVERLKGSLARQTDSCRIVDIDTIVITGVPVTSQSDVISAVDAINALAGKRVKTVHIDEAVYELFRTGKFARIGYGLENRGKSTLDVLAAPFPIIRNIEITGNEMFADSTLMRVSRFKDSEINSAYRLREVYDNIISFYQYHGYDLAQIREARLDTANAQLNIHLDEGRVVGISVEGNEKTRWWVVTSYFPLDPGRFYNKFLAARGVQQIYSCGLYDNVNLRLEEREGGGWVTITVKEKKFTYARISGRYHEEYHPEGLIKLGYANLFGTGNEVSVYGKFSERCKLYQLQLRADRIFRTFVTYNIRLFYANNQIGQFVDNERVSLRSEKRLGVKIGVGQQLARHGLFDITGRYEQVRYQNALDKFFTDRRVGSLQFEVNFDTKDRFAFPTSGGALAASFELAGAALATDEVFRKLEAFLEGYHPLNHKLNFHPRVAVGWSQDGLPLYDRFYLGGSRTFYGYMTDQLVGDKYFLSNAELRLGPIYGFYLSARYDAGQVFDRFEEVRLHDLLHAFGLSLVLDTPLGPLAVSYGRAERKHDKLYLNLGYDF